MPRSAKTRRLVHNQQILHTLLDKLHRCHHACKPGANDDDFSLAVHRAAAFS